METLELNRIRMQLLDRKEKLVTTIQHRTEAGQLLDLLRQVDSALERMDDGSYGICEVCHESIEDDRLVIDPLITVCLPHLSRKQQKTLEDDLELSNKIQSGLLPKNNFSVNGWEVSYHYSPAGIVSGDYCDIIGSDRDNEFLFALGDVTGKGVAASMLMTQMHAIFHSLVNVTNDLGSIFDQANRLFCESTLNSLFMTLIFGKATKDGILEICNAGHCLPILVKNNFMSTINSSAMPIGLFCSLEYSFTKIKLNKGESLVLYTDGLSEAFNGIEEYGIERINKIIGINFLQKPKELIQNILKDLKGFMKEKNMTDDLTIMVISRTEN